MIGLAWKIKDVSDFMGRTGLYRLNPRAIFSPAEPTRLVSHVLVSECWHNGPNTIIFAANDEGILCDWTELPGTIYGRHDTAGALRAFGYRIIEEKPRESRKTGGGLTLPR